MVPQEVRLEDDATGTEWLSQQQQQQSVTMCLDLEAMSKTAPSQPANPQSSVHFAAATLRVCHVKQATIEDPVCPV